VYFWVRADKKVAAVGGGTPSKGDLMDRVNWLDWVVMTLLIVGGLNWGLVAIAEFDLVAWIFGGMDFGETNAASRIVYGLVGLAALYEALRLPMLLGGGRHQAVPSR
jgi:uncharacterized membrane protein YuzA (DUF378 family)